MPAVRQPQRKFLAVLLTTILALRGRVTCHNLSRYCEYSERTIARQFRAPFDWPDFPQYVLTAALEPRAELTSAQDASFMPKSSKQIEFLFRDSKQFTDLSDCQARAAAVLDFHFHASLATLNLARAEEPRARTDQIPRVFSMASWKQRQFNERLLD
jgi:hypothetical protein